MGSGANMGFSSPKIEEFVACLSELPLEKRALILEQIIESHQQIVEGTTDTEERNFQLELKFLELLEGKQDTQEEKEVFNISRTASKESREKTFQDASDSGQIDNNTRAAELCCPVGHRLQEHSFLDLYVFCDQCGYRARRYCHSPKMKEIATMMWCCETCDYSLCVSCCGKPELEFAAGSTETTILEFFYYLKSRVGNSHISHGSITVSTNGQDIQLEAFVVGSVVRQFVPQGLDYVCAAAATAGAINSCREGIPAFSRSRDCKKLSWRQILEEHFQDKMGLKVFSKNGDAVTWKVGQVHIKQVLSSFSCHCVDLIDREQAQPENRAAAWASLVLALQRPRTTVFAHTQLGLSGHYSLIAGAAGQNLFGGRNEDITNNGEKKKNSVLLTPVPPCPYDPVLCSLLTNTVSQAPIERISFERLQEQSNLLTYRIISFY